jgi:hypothetical protein
LEKIQNEKEEGPQTKHWGIKMLKEQAKGEDAVKVFLKRYYGIGCKRNRSVWCQNSQDRRERMFNKKDSGQ